jgi:hypothetical protein
MAERPKAVLNPEARLGLCFGSLVLISNTENGVLMTPGVVLFEAQKLVYGGDHAKR